MRPQTERIVRLEAEAGCCVRRTNVPTTGALAQSACAILTVYQDQHGTEQHDGLLKDPVSVHSLGVKKPERLEAWGRVFFLALLLWRVMARALRLPVDATHTPWMGWDKQATERPTACMMVPKCAGVMGVKRGHHRPRARPLSVVQPQSLTALDVPAACCTACPSGEGDGEDGGTPRTAAEADPALAGRRPPADARQDHEQPPGVRPCSSGGEGPEQP